MFSENKSHDDIFELGESLTAGLIKPTYYCPQL